MDEQAIVFLTSTGSGQELSDGDFLSSILWGPGVAETLKQAARRSDVDAAGASLQRELSRVARKGGRKKVRTGSGFRRHSLWSRSANGDSQRAAELAGFWEAIESKGKTRKKRMGARRAGKRQGANGKSNGRPFDGQNTLAHRGWNKIVDWLHALGPGDSVSPFELLILLEILREAGGDLRGDVFWPLWRTALTAAVEMSVRLNELTEPLATGDQRILAAGELRWQAGLLFSGVRNAGKLCRSGRRVLRKELLDATDTDGTPNAELLSRLAYWLAPVVRAAEWGEAFSTRLWDDESGERFRSLIHVVAPFCRPDGRLALSEDASHNVVPLLSSASRLAGWKKKSLPVSFLSEVGNGVSRKRSKRRTNGRPVKTNRLPVTQSDWARLACLRSDWAVDADTLIVAHHGERPHIYLAVLGRPVLSGVWDIEVSIDGRSQTIDDEWTCCCWFSDEDADYLELEASLSNGIRLERQVLLSRKEHFVLLADSIAGAGQSRIDYCSKLPVIRGIDAEPETETRECVLKAKTQIARVFPLPLPEERVMGTAGAFGPAEAALELRHAAVGGLYAPLVIDWNPDRKRSNAEWRTLTVAEQGRVLKSIDASGYRLRIADHQLLIYHSLTKSGEMRSVLGHHTASETVIGKLDESGVVEPILVVE